MLTRMSRRKNNLAPTTNRLVAVAILLALSGPNASAWGERGHDVVTRVAVRLLAAKTAKGTALATQLGRKEFMLGHLSNVPDIVWRNQGEAIEKVNAPTHFLDLEYVSPELVFSTVPRTPGDALSRMKALCARRPRRISLPDEIRNRLPTRAAPAPPPGGSASSIAWPFGVSRPPLPEEKSFRPPSTALSSRSG